MKEIYKTILLTGFIAGLLDISAAIGVAYIRSGKLPLKIFNYISSGAVDKEIAFKEGISMILLGLFIHFFIAYAFTIFYFWIYPKVSLLSINKIVSGLIYGAFAWIVMNMLVLPLSKIQQAPFNATSVLIGMVTLMLMIGLPIAINAHKYYSHD